MNPIVTELMDLAFRWIHVVAGVLSIGLLYYLNFVNGELLAGLEAPERKKVALGVAPRVLYFVRWGVLYTWVSGFMLLGIVVYMGGVLLPGDSTLGIGAGAGIGVAVLVFGWPLYDLPWKALASKPIPAAVISWGVLMAIAFGLAQVFSGRAVFIHVGALLGTLMTGNVWMRIWPSQKRVLAALRAGESPAPKDAAMAQLRSKHNTYMSVPLLFLMLSVHFPSPFSHDYNWAILGGVVAVGWGAVRLLYAKSASPAPARVP